jgi:hypothetical protein
MADAGDFDVVLVGDAEGIETARALEILDETQALAVMEYLKKEYDQAKTDMEARNQKLILWRRNMEAIASTAPKNHPFKNSSNVVVPVTQVLTQNLFAKVKGTFDARNPLWTSVSLKKDDHEQKLAKIAEKFLQLQASSPYDLDMESVLQDLFFETILTGGAFPQVVYSVESWRVRDETGSDKEVVWHDGPQVIVRPLESVKYRRGVPKISRLPWIGIDVALTEIELRERASKGIYNVEAVGEVIKFARSTPTDIEQQQQEADSFDSGETANLFDITEVYVYWDVDGSGVPVDLLLTVHMESGKILKQQYNTLGARNIASSRYVHRPFALTGRGTGQMTESMQTEVTVTHNMRNDNAKTAGMRMLAVRKSAGFGAKREIYPGAIWELDDPERDVKAIQLGEVYPSSLQAENQGWSIAQRAVGLSDVQMGFADSTLASRDTAKGTAMRLQQGDSILGSVVEGLRNTLSQIGMLVWMQCVTNKDRVMARERKAMRLSEEELVLLDEALGMEISEVPMRMRFTVKTTEADKTYEQQRQNMLGLSQVFAGFTEKTVPLVGMVYGPQGMQMKQQAPEAWQYMARILAGSSKLLSRIFEFFGITDVDNYVPNTDSLDAVLDQMADMGGAFQAPQGAPGVDQGQAMMQQMQQQMARQGGIDGQPGAV